MAVAVFGIAAVGARVAVTVLRAPLDTRGTVTFDRELRIPALAESRVEDGVRVFDLTMQRGESDLGRGTATPTWGINGPHLAPTLRAARGEEVRVRVTNRLGEASTLHWHGMRLPARMDGGPHQMIEPGATWTPQWNIDQPAAGLWYHPHPHGETARHVYRGLAGMFLIDDDAESRLALPRRYGIDDLPMIVQDRRFHDDGTLDTSTSLFQSEGIIGDTVLVNGTPGPYVDVTTRTVRLRLLNGSNTRPYDFVFDDHREFSVIGTDSGLLPAPVPVRAVPLSPGERAEVVVTFRPGERVRLQSEPTPGGARFAGGSDHLEIAEFRAASDLGGVGTVPDRLVDVAPIPETAATVTRSFSLGGSTIDRKPMDMARIDEVVTAGATEIWSVANSGDAVHNFHIHDAAFQILDIDGDPPPRYLGGWKDTVWVPRDSTVRLIMTFAHHTDTEVPYMYHCHLLRHEDEGMMGQFLVVPPGTSTDPADYSARTGHHH
ncbi:MAG: multicopper oxidase domain-containing protein [Gordonia sp. (in: high G+C Gram-positive bacteria)]|uniref:multicopper oxidase family protein n=1 Tax=Gordonia sp. (in: high G+C Gram-positive bacteria) TaxID=84139 RepID=UPI0039E25586